MTNELGTTLQDIEAKAERKREANRAIQILDKGMDVYGLPEKEIRKRHVETIRKYIEEN